MVKDNFANVFPIIETERLILRQLKAEDAVVLHHYWTDKDVIEYMTLDPFKNIQETKDMIILLQNLTRAKEGFRWAITNKSENKPLGTCGFHNVKPEHCRAEMGYELGKEYWGQGIMPEALTAIIDFGFHRVGYHRIEAFVNYGNSKSVRTLEKIGFQLDGLLRNYEFARGKFVDQYCYSLLESDA